MWRGASQIIAIVFADGGLGEVGKHAIGQALKDPNIRVRAIGRDPERIAEVASVTAPDLETSKHRLEVVKLDASLKSNQAKLEELLCGVIGVISTVGNRQPGKHFEAHERYARASTRNIVAAMEAQKVHRLVMISSMGVGANSMPVALWLTAIWKCMMWCAVSSAIEDLVRAEEAVKASSLDYLIVRPVGVSPDRQPRGAWTVCDCEETRSAKVHFEIAKEDVAAFMFEEVLSPTLHKKAVVLAHDKQ